MSASDRAPGDGPPDPSIGFRDRAVYLRDSETLVLADVHLGRDERSNVQVRLGEHEDVTERFEALCSSLGPETVVVAGDLLHSFSTLPRGVLETVRTLKTTAEDAGAELVVTPGNHDTMLGKLWDGPSEQTHRAGEWLVCHGHELPAVDADLRGVVVGHDHPTIVIEGQRRPCYLYGEAVLDGLDVLMLPAFTRLAAGVPVNDLDGPGFQSPLVREPDRFRPVVRDEAADRTLTFPPLGQFRRLL